MNRSLRVFGALAWAGVLCMFAVPRVSAQETVVDEDTTVITSDGGLRLDYARHLAVFKDNVLVRDHRGTLRADEMHVQFVGDGSEIDTIEAVGGVRIEQEGRTALGENALIRKKEGRIELTGNPRILRERDIYSAEKITILNDSNTVLFEPKAKLVIYQQGERTDLF